MDVPQIISAIAVIGGIVFGVIKGWSILHERQKQHWKILNQHAELLAKLAKQMADMPRCDTYVRREDCEKNKGVLDALRISIQQLTDAMVEVQVEMKRQSEKITEDLIKMGRYVAKFETLLDERTERRSHG